MIALFWGAMALVTLALIGLTTSLLTHDPATCRTCVDKRARVAAASRYRRPTE